MCGTCGPSQRPGFANFLLSEPRWCLSACKYLWGAETGGSAFSAALADGAHEIVNLAEAALLLNALNLPSDCLNPFFDALLVWRAPSQPKYLSLGL